MYSKGRDSKPLGGFTDEPNGSWVPIMAGPSQWVSLSKEAPCVQWSHLHPGPPPWSETGEDNEDLTRNLACCLELTPEPTKKPTVAPTPQPTEVSTR